MEENWKEDIIKNKLGGKREWTDSERMELCHQLDKDIDSKNDSALGKVPIAPEERWTEDNWKEKMAEHPIFSPYLQEEQKDGEVPINDLSEGLAQLKYSPDYNTPLEMAQSYKDEGVNHFKYKKYRFAIASFTEGIKANGSDNELNSQLYNNRGAAHYHLKNYRSTIKDCQKALELKPDYIKAIQRAIQCATNLTSWGEVIKWCDKGLVLESTNEEFLKQRTAAVKNKKIQDRDNRKKALEMKKKMEDSSKLLSEIAKRRITLEPNSSNEQEDSIEENPHQILLRDLEPTHLAAKDSPVYLNAEGEMVWPVLFLYPEHNESDCILDFNENSRFIDHLDEMFGGQVPPAPWDTETKYKPEDLLLFYEDMSKSELVKVSPSSVLKAILSNPRYRVKVGTPGFIVLVNNSKFMKAFISQYSV